MKTKILSLSRTAAGYALIMVLIITATSILILGATLNRTYTVARVNDRNNQMVASQNAAEAAVEKVYSRMAYDFQNWGVRQVTNNLSIYAGFIPDECCSFDLRWIDRAVRNGGAGSQNHDKYGQPRQCGRRQGIMELHS